MSYRNIRVTVEEGVAVLTFDRPEGQKRIKS